MFRPSKPSNQSTVRPEPGVVSKLVVATTWLLHRRTIHPEVISAINSSAKVAHQAAQKTNDECEAAIKSSNALLKKLT